MKTFKITLIAILSFTLIKCADNSSSDSGGSTATPQYAYITDGTKLKVIEIDPLNANTIMYTSAINLNTSYFVSVSPDIAYVAQYDAIEPYLSLVDISNPNALSAQGVAKNSTNNFSLVSDMFTIQGTGFITDLYRGINTIDATNFTGTSNTGSDAMSLTKIGNNLYVIDQVNGLSIYDISTPNNPTYTGVRNNTDVDTSSYGDSPFGQYHSWVETDGTFIYVANIIDKKLKKFDATTLNLISELVFEGNTTAFAISNGYAYITSKASANAPLQTSFDGISMFDLATMTFTNRQTLNKASGVAISGNYAYVTDADALHVFDVSSGNLVAQSSSTQGKGNFIALGE